MRLKDFLASHTHTYRAGSGIDIISPIDTFNFNFYAKLFCSLSHTWIFTFIDPLCDHDDDKHVNIWICYCVDDLCMKRILERCLCFLCRSLSLIVDNPLFKIHNFWKNRVDIVLVCKL